MMKFTNSRHIKGVGVHVFDSPSCPYDCILGRDFLRSIGLLLDFQNDSVAWMDESIDMKTIQFVREKTIDDVRDLGLQPNDNHYQQLINQCTNDINWQDGLEDEYLLDDAWDNFADEILDRNYSKVTPEEVASQQHHLSRSDRLLLQQTLAKYEIIFDGKLGCYPHEKFHLDLVDGAKPVYRHAHNVPYRHGSLFKCELDNLVRDRVLEKCGRSSWASPTCIVPKKDQHVRFVSDFRDLNKLLLRKPFPLPKIQDVMNRRRRYNHFTKINLSMMFYCFELDDESK